jgi:hypothetical protein
VKEKASRKYNKLLKILEKEKSDLAFELDSEQKGVHARRDSDVGFISSFNLKFSFSLYARKSFKWTSFIAFVLFFRLPPNTFRLYFLFSFSSTRFSMQAQIKILNFMDKKEQTAQALTKKKSTLMELEAQAQKVSGFFFSHLFLRLTPVLCLLCE